MWWLWLALLASAAGAGARADSGFTFYRSLRRAGAGTRRVFGGAPAGEWTPACALLDRSLAALCSCAVLAPRWALTAAHCVRSNVAYVRYNAPSSDDNLAAVHLLYAHPEYRVKQADEGAGMDVVLLHHDVGLVRTRRDMTLASPHAARARPTPAGPPRYSPPPQRAGPLRALSDHDVDTILGQEVEMLGYGRTERAGAGASLRAARLRVTACQRGADAWRHCACAVGNASGVCSGDSGGPVLYMGKQIGVTSMGPLQCAASVMGDASSAPALSVFTALRPYAELINATMLGTDRAVRMRVVPSRAPAHASLLAAAPALFCAVWPLLTTDHGLLTIDF